jgi:predicted outer membrane lipoprotein
VKREEVGRLIVGTLVIAAFGVVLAFMLLNDKPGTDILVGALAAAFGAVVHWWYQSSKSSEDKTRLLAKANPVDPE